MSGYVTPGEWRVWLRQHGIKPSTLRELAVVPESLFDREAGPRDAVHMRCEHMVVDADTHNPIIDEKGDLATVTVWRPMRRLPGKGSE